MSPVERVITTLLPRGAHKSGWVPMTKPAGMLEFTAPPTTGWNPAAVRAATALSKVTPATLGIEVESLDWTLLLGLAKSSNGIPAEARSMICFQIGAAMVAPKISPG